MTIALENNNNTTNTDVSALSEEETKQYLTPFAFKMDESLFGLPLASPSRRGIALLIDFSLIAMLSDISGIFLAFAVAVTLYYLGNKKRAQERGKKKGHKRRAIMRFIAAFIVFIVLLDSLPTLFDHVSIEEGGSEVSSEDISLSFTEVLTLTATAIPAMKAIADSDCQAFDCWKTQLDLLAIQMANVSYEGDIKVTKAQLTDIFTDIGKEIELPLNEQHQLTASMQNNFEKEFSRLSGEDTLALSKSEFEASENIATPDIPDNDAILVLADDAKLTDVDKLKEEEKSKKPVYSIIEWVKGIIEDLGLGFGWATFYFTAFIALGKGQTLGKKLLGIKVLQLDGTPLSFWDSFERYGGYGAGLATGLLGFIQIYWDPNKQAIHDRISATVVIDVRKARLHHNK